MRWILKQLARLHPTICPGCIGFILILSGIAQAQLPLPGGSGGLNIPQAGDSIKGSEPGAEKKQQINSLPPKITRLEASCLSSKGMKLSIRGSNLGDSKGSSIRLNGKLKLKSDSWSNSRIKVSIPAGNYRYESIELWQGSKRITARSIRGCPKPTKVAKPDTTSQTKAVGRSAKKSQTTDLSLRLQLQPTGKGRQTQAVVTAINKGPATAKGYNLSLFPSHSAQHQPSSIHSLSAGPLGNSAQKNVTMPLAPKTSREHKLVVNINQAMPYLCASIQSQTMDNQRGNNVVCQPVKGLTPQAEGGPQPEPPTSTSVSNIPSASGFGSAVRKQAENRAQPDNREQQPKTSSFSPNQQQVVPLKQTDWRSVANKLGKLNSQQYRHVVFNPPADPGDQTYTVARSENVKGLLLSRENASMSALGDGLFDDHMGNLVLKGELIDWQGNRIPYSLTATPLGETVFGADRDKDGIIDVALGSSKSGPLWMMGQKNVERLLLCMQEAALPASMAIRLCVPCLDSSMEPGTALTAEEVACVNRSRNRRGGGPLGSALGKGAPDLFGDPECGPKKPGGITRDADDDDLARAREMVRHWNEAAAEEEDPGLRRAMREFARATEDAADEFDRFLEIRREQGSHSQEAEEQWDNVIAASEIMMDKWEDLEEAYLEKAYAGTLPRIGDGTPQAGFEDPRCAGRKTAQEQGSVWSDLCYENGRHVGMMECIRRINDATHTLTGGRCWQEPGPAGGVITVCEGSRRDRNSGAGSGNDPSGGASPGGNGSGPTDARRSGLGNRSRRGTAGRYIDITPIGGFLAGLCASGGCPDPSPVENTEASGTLH